MDLDALDVSKARCYNCNKIGHLSKDCPSPRKIKYNNSKAPDKHRARPSLNLINLDPPENSKSTSNLFFIQPTKPEEEDSYDKINADLKRISDKISRKFDNVVASIKQEIWKIDREKESLLMCSRINSSLTTLNPKALEFIPGAGRHGITREIQLNSMQIEPASAPMKRKISDIEDKPNKLAKTSNCEYIDWLQIDSDTESYEFELESDSDISSIVWMGDSPAELKKNTTTVRSQSPRRGRKDSTRSSIQAQGLSTWTWPWQVNYTIDAKSTSSM
jgi:hypothetical protein